MKKETKILVEKCHLVEGHVMKFYKVIKQTKCYTTYQQLEKTYFELLDGPCAFWGVDVVDESYGEPFRKHNSNNWVKRLEVYDSKKNYWSDNGVFYSAEESKALKRWQKKRKYIPSKDEIRDQKLEKLLNPTLKDKINNWFNR